jgi:AcrR family transcriptional regulator
MAEPQEKVAPSSRTRVLAGATAEFAAHGFAGARIDRIAARVGLNVRMIYYPFGNKEGLYRGVLREIYGSAADMLDGVLAEGDPERRTVGAVSGYFDLLTSHPHFADVMVRELLDGGEHLQKLFKDEPSLYERIHRRANTLVEGLSAAGSVRKLPVAEVVVMVVFSASFLWASRGAPPLFLDGPARSGAEWKALWLDVFLNGLRAPRV